MCSIEFRSGDIHGHSITFTFSSKAVVILAVCLLCWKTVSEWRASSSASECHSTCWNPCFPSMNRSSPVQAVVMQPQTMMLPPPFLTIGKAQFSWYSSPGCCQTRHTCGTPSVKQVYLKLIRPQDMVPVIHALGQAVFSKLFAGFFCEPASEEASFWDDGHANRLVAVCGVWSKH